jgi:hypothetical protein
MRHSSLSPAGNLARGLHFGPTLSDGFGSRPEFFFHFSFFMGRNFSLHQNFQEPKIDDYVFWDQNLCIVSDANSPISLTGIDKIKHSSIIYIHIIFLIFLFHRANRLWLKAEVIHATS